MKKQIQLVQIAAVSALMLGGISAHASGVGHPSSIRADSSEALRQGVIESVEQLDEAFDKKAAGPCIDPDGRVGSGAVCGTPTPEECAWWKIWC